MKNYTTIFGLPLRKKYNTRQAYEMCKKLKEKRILPCSDDFLEHGKTLA